MCALVNKANERLSRYNKRCLNEQDEALFKKRFTAGAEKNYIWLISLQEESEKTVP